MGDIEGSRRDYGLWDFLRSNVPEAEGNKTQRAAGQ